MMQLPAAPPPEAAVPGTTASDLTQLSRRERDVVALVLEGATDAEIADCLSVSLRTVKDRLRRAFRTLGVRNRINLIVALAFAGDLATQTRNKEKSYERNLN